MFYYVNNVPKPHYKHLKIYMPLNTVQMINKHELL